MKLIFAIVVVALSPAAVGASLQFQCPERYLSKPAELSEMPRGWRGAVAQVTPGLLLSGGGMIGGSLQLQPPPELRGSDMPTKHGWDETRYPVLGESWAYCAYGQGSEIRLFRRVDTAGIRECSIRWSQPKPSTALKVEVTCR